MRYQRKSRAHASIVDLASDPREWFGLRVVADYLLLNERTVRARIEEGLLEAEIDGRVYRISKVSLMAYRSRVCRVKQATTATSARAVTPVTSSVPR